MKLNPNLKWLLPILLLLIGLKGISLASAKETQRLHGFELYLSALEATCQGPKSINDPKCVPDFNTAYALFIQSSYEFDDPHLKAIALYEAATAGWVGDIADYQSLVRLYQQALRLDPNFYEAAFDLEYLYQLRSQNPGDLPSPDPGPLPSREERPPSGDF